MIQQNSPSQQSSSTVFAEIKEHKWAYGLGITMVAVSIIAGIALMVAGQGLIGVCVMGGGFVATGLLFTALRFVKRGQGSSERPSNETITNAPTGRTQTPSKNEKKTEGRTSIVLESEESSSFSPASFETRQKMTEEEKKEYQRKAMFDRWKGEGDPVAVSVEEAHERLHALREAGIFS